MPTASATSAPSATARPRRSVFSVDVEDWFNTMRNEPKPSEWDTIPSHVEKNLRRFLDLFDETDTKVTCFFLGYIGRRFPDLVKETAARGHEIASHGFFHQCIYDLTREGFRKDVTESKKVLEDAAGRAVKGYRAPGFSVDQRSPWFFEELAAAGYEYDSSVFPAPHRTGGMRTSKLAPHVMDLGGGAKLTEFPITAVDVLGKPMCFFGGGYLRLFPYEVIRLMSRRVLAEERPVVYYIHPREIDPHHPRSPMKPLAKFSAYVNLASTEPKVRSILQDFPSTSFEGYLKDHPVS